METGYYAIGILSFLYYICLVWHTKKINSTFAGFWVVFGVLNIGIGLLVWKTPIFIDYAILAVSILLWLFFIAVEILILCAMAVMPKRKLKYIIILGAQIRGKKITNSLKRRLDKGLRYLQENPETICIVSGGKGKGEEISEAEAMFAYLKDCGVDGERICMEDKSTTTCENLIFSKQFIQNLKKDSVGIVSNNFHIYRAMKMARLLGYKKVFALPATTNMVVFPNYMVREFFALIKIPSELKRTYDA